MRSSGVVAGLLACGAAFLSACDGSVAAPGDTALQATTRPAIHFKLPRGDSPFSLFYDFDDGQIPVWGGNAGMMVQDGSLQLTAGHNQWRYRIFDYENPGRYRMGSFQFEAVFGPQAYFFDLKGHSESNLYSYQLGPAVHFIQGEVWVDVGTFEDTGARYTPGAAFRVRAEFSNRLGDRGRYLLFMQEIDPPSRERFVGAYPYKAPDGRLADITEFGFSGRNLDEVETTSFLVDNVRLDIYR